MRQGTILTLFILALGGCDPSVSTVGGPGGGESGGGGSTGSTGSSTTTTETDGWVPSDCDGCAILAGPVWQPNPCPGAQEALDASIECMCANCSEVCSGQLCGGPPTMTTPECSPCGETYCKDLVDACGADRRVDWDK